MADLEIPDCVREIIDWHRTCDVAECDAMGAVRAAAPVIVAAELRRLISQLRAESASLNDEQASGVLYAALSLKYRADELRPPTAHTEPAE